MAAGTLPRPPFSVELLADLHAGNLPAGQAAQLWPEVRRDPDAMRYLDSLDEVNTRLHDLGRDERITHPMPDEVFARLEGFLDALVSSAEDDSTERVGPRATPVDPNEVTRRITPAETEDTARVDPTTHARRMATVHQLRNRDQAAHPGPAATAPMPALPPSIFDTGRLDPRDIAEPDPEIDDEPAPPRPMERMSNRMRWLTAAAAAVAVLAGGVVAVDAVRGRTVSPEGVPTAAVPLDASMPTSAILGAMGKHEISGPLAKGDALIGCLTAAGLNRTQLGARSVTFNGQDAVLVLLPGATPPAITAVVLGNACTPGNPQVLATVDIQ